MKFKRMKFSKLEKTFAKLRAIGFGTAPLLALTLLAVGCESKPAAFHINLVELEAKQVPAQHRQTIASILEAMFGTPDQPAIPPESGLDLRKIELAAGPVWSDEHGRARGLYRQHCGHCHGTSGDGMGPTAAILNPYPRDYRRGMYKFKSTERAAMPTNDDLEYILRKGIVGTAMPSFDLLPPEEIASLVEYVKYLSMRGQVEYKLIEKSVDLGEGEAMPTDREFLIGEIVAPVKESWQTASELVIAPQPPENFGTDESIAAGRTLFYGAKAQCVKCHGPTGLGDGQTTDYDEWTKPLVTLRQDVAKAPEEISDRKAELAKDGDISAEDKQKELNELEERAKSNSRLASLLETDTLEPRNIIPRNLRLGVYRFGRRPLDTYRRVHAGIMGTPMPGGGPASPGATGTLAPAEIWQVVDYVRSLPYEPISRPPQHRGAAVRPRM